MRRNLSRPYYHAARYLGWVRRHTRSTRSNGELADAGLRRSERNSPRTADTLSICSGHFQTRPTMQLGFAVEFIEVFHLQEESQRPCNQETAPAKLGFVLEAWSLLGSTAGLCCGSKASKCHRVDAILGSKPIHLCGSLPTQLGRDGCDCLQTRTKTSW